MRDFKHILTARAWRPPVFKGNYQTLVFVIVRFYILHAFILKCQWTAWDESFNIENNVDI